MWGDPARTGLGGPQAHGCGVTPWGWLKGLGPIDVGDAVEMGWGAGPHGCGVTLQGWPGEAQSHGCGVTPWGWLKGLSPMDVGNPLGTGWGAGPHGCGVTLRGRFEGGWPHGCGVTPRGWVRGGVSHGPSHSSSHGDIARRVTRDVARGGGGHVRPAADCPFSPPARIIPLNTGNARAPVRLTCHVWGFYPPEVTVIWLRNGDVVGPGDHPAITATPNGDWTYQTRVALTVAPEAGDVYTCSVQHASLDEPLLEDWSESGPAVAPGRLGPRWLGAPAQPVLSSQDPG
uniref:Ig-like domain-containing protein n=1 Tax=Dromaius novaehollandiae TaxID=8790 RepID=A0A8C4K5X5_DRONO